MIKTWWKGVRGLLASVKELFTPEKNGNRTGKNGTAWNKAENSVFYAERETAV